MNPESANSGPPLEPSPGSTAEAPARAPSLAEIRAAVRALDPGSDPNLPSVPLGVPAIDGHLPWGGLALPGLHEIVGMPADGAAIAFTAAILGRLSRGRPVLWSSLRRPGLYGYGLADLGWDPAALLLARGRRHEDVLWQLEEGLRSGAVAAVVGDVVAARPHGQPPPAAGGRGGAVAGDHPAARWRGAAALGGADPLAGRIPAEPSRPAGLVSGSAAVPRRHPCPLVCGMGR